MGDHGSDEVIVGWVYLGIESTRILAKECTNELMSGVVPKDPVGLHLCFDGCEFGRCMMKRRAFEAAWLPIAQGVVCLIGVKEKLAYFSELAVAAICRWLGGHDVLENR